MVAPNLPTPVRPETKAPQTKHSVRAVLRRVHACLCRAVTRRCPLRNTARTPDPSLHQRTNGHIMTNRHHHYYDHITAADYYQSCLRCHQLYWHRRQHPYHHRAVAAVKITTISASNTNASTPPATKLPSRRLPRMLYFSVGDAVVRRINSHGHCNGQLSKRYSSRRLTSPPHTQTQAKIR
jgi:hypothetical protein